MMDDAIQWWFGHGIQCGWCSKAHTTSKYGYEVCIKDEYGIMGERNVSNTIRIFSRKH